MRPASGFAWALFRSASHVVELQARLLHLEIDIRNHDEIRSMNLMASSGRWHVHFHRLLHAQYIPEPLVTCFLDVQYTLAVYMIRGFEAEKHPGSVDEEEVGRLTGLLVSNTVTC